MKLKVSPRVGEFVGTLFLVNGHGVEPDTFVPDVKRNLSSGLVTVAKEAIHAVQASIDTGVDDLSGVANIAAPALLARAYDFSKRLPTISRFFYNISTSWGTCNNFSHDDLMRYGLLHHSDVDFWSNHDHDEKALTEVRKDKRPIPVRMDERLAACDVDHEYHILHTLGVVNDYDGYCRLQDFATSASRHTPSAELREVVN